VWAFGSKIPLNPFDEQPAIFQEKVDGSQFSFGNLDGELFMRSKSQEQSYERHDKMFAAAVEQVAIRHADGSLPEGVVFRGEYLQKPKHNTLAYDRTPDDLIVVFDAQRLSGFGSWEYLEPQQAAILAGLVGFEFVPTWEQTVTHPDDILAMLDRQSFLGGQRVEGVVLKRYDLIVPQFAAPLFCKYVSERFKEVHQSDWKERNPGKEYGAILADKYRTEARFHKAVQHLREEGRLTGTPKDIGPLIAEVRRDIDEECKAEIAEALYKKWDQTAGRTLTRGLPEWYKEQLLREAFDE
jgi:hypothetical protein